MELFYKKMGSGHPLIIIHGLFGMLDNWLSLGKQYAEHFEVYLIDQRNHGHSPHSDEFDYWAMGDDLAQFIEDHGLEDAHILGHSMGGKSLMNFLVQNPDHKGKCIVADIGPKAYPIHHQQIIAGLASIPTTELKSRGEADKILKTHIDQIGVRQFLLKNLYWNADKKLEWRFNLPVIAREIHAIVEGIPYRNPIESDIMFVRGTASNYILDKDWPVIKEMFPKAELASIEGVGHWLHAESPENFYNITFTFLNS